VIQVIIVVIIVRADLALCGILSFWCNNNIEQIDRSFRQSVYIGQNGMKTVAIETYGMMTIRK